MDELGNLWLIMLSGGGGSTLSFFYTTPSLAVYTDPLGSPYSV
jgi:hypothetical protein